MASSIARRIGTSKMEIKHASSEEQNVDILLKALPREKLEEFRIKLDIINFELRGSVEN